MSYLLVLRLAMGGDHRDLGGPPPRGAGGAARARSVPGPSRYLASQSPASGPAVGRPASTTGSSRRSCCSTACTWPSRCTRPAATQSPIRFVVYLHLVAVSLLASYRTGLKIALWHSLLLFVVVYAQAAGAVPPVDVTPGRRHRVRSDARPQRHSFWLFAIATSIFSALNERELRQRRADLQSLVDVGARLDAVPTPIQQSSIVLRGPRRAVRLRARRSPRRVGRPGRGPRDPWDGARPDHPSRPGLDRPPSVGATRYPAGQAARPGARPAARRRSCPTPATSWSRR